MDALPEAYDRSLFAQKCPTLCEHMYESYPERNAAMLFYTDLHTPRLLLRQWRPSDFEPFAAMNADTDVMRYYPSPWSREQSDAFGQRVMRLIDQRGWGFWAVEERASERFIGFVGLHVPSDDLPFSPYRLAPGETILGPGLCHGGRTTGHHVRLHTTPPP